MSDIQDLFEAMLENGRAKQAFALIEQKAYGDPEEFTRAIEFIQAPLKNLYDDYRVDEVEEFAATCRSNLDAAVAQRVIASINDDYDASLKWGKLLETVYNERIMRELHDAVQVGDFKTALLRAVRILHHELPPETLQQRAQRAGAVLGTIATHQENTSKFFKLLAQNTSKLRVSIDNVNIMETQCREQFGRIAQTGASGPSKMTDDFNKLVRDIITILPGRMEMREPTEEETSRFVNVGRALFRAVFHRGQRDRIVDATLVLLDFYPRELSQMGAMAGVQARAYQGLGFTAKKICLLAFGHLAESKKLCDVVLEYYKAPSSAPYFRSGVELMGAMRSANFEQFLIKSLSAAKDKPLQNELIRALGSIGQPEARTILLKELKDTLNAKVIDPPRIAQATIIIESLGKLTRSPRLEEKERVSLTRHTIAAIPDGQKRLSTLVATSFFNHKPSVLPLELRNWATAELVNGLWSANQRMSFEKGGEQQSDFLGARRNIIAALKVVGPDCMPILLKTAEEHILKYSGAFLALGELLTEIGDESAVPLIEKMTMQVIHLDEDKIGKYQQEHYWDAADQTQKPLSRDHVIETLIFALKKIGGAQANLILANVANLYKGGRLGTPSETTARILMDAEKAAAAEGASDGGSGATPMQRKASEEDIQKAIKTLNSRGLLKSKDALRRKKIQAIQILASSGSFEAVAPIIQHLEDKDRLTQEAAVSALGVFGQQLVSDKHRKAYLMELIEGFNNMKGTGQRRLAGAIVDIAAGNKELMTYITTYLKSSLTPKVRSQLSQLLLDFQRERNLTTPIIDKSEIEPEASTGQGPLRPEHFADLNEDSSDGGTPAKKKKMSIDDKMEAKRQYMIARRAWIAGGKKGPQPQPPEG